MNDHNQTLFFSKTRKYLYHDTNIYIKWEDLCTSILYELNLNILHSTFHGRNKEFFSTFTTNNAVTTNKMCGEYLRNSHFAVLRNSHFAVLRNSHFAVLRNSHFTVLRNSHFAVFRNSHFAVLRNSHFAVLRNSHFAVLRNSHFAVLRNSHFAVTTLYPQNNVLILVLNICHHCPTWHT